MYREREHPELRMGCMVLYVVMSVSAVFQLFEATVIFGLILLVIAFFMAKMQRVTAMGTPYASHMEWISSTLSIGTFLVYPVFMSIGIYFLWKDLNLAPLKEAMNSDEPSAIVDAMHAFIARNTPHALKVTTIAMIPPTLWWVRRCWEGFSLAKEDQPVNYPGSLI
jgi:uncharacterized membrane protein